MDSIISSETRAESYRSGIDGQVINSISLEPITSMIDAVNVVLNFSDARETITVTDASNGQTTVDSTAGESLTFTNPTGSLKIMGGGRP